MLLFTHAEERERERERKKKKKTLKPKRVSSPHYNHKLRNIEDNHKVEKPQNREKRLPTIKAIKHKQIPYRQVVVSLLTQSNSCIHKSKKKKNLCIHFYYYYYIKQK